MRSNIILLTASLLTFSALGLAQELKIVEIPTHQVTFHGNPAPFTLHPKGLNLKNTGLGGANAKSFKPIGDAIFGEDGDIWVSFPDLNLTALFKRAEGYKTTLYGTTNFGGNGAPIVAPGRLAMWAGGLYISSLENGMILRLSQDGKLQDVFELVDYRNPYTGPEATFLAVSKDQAGLLGGFDRKGRQIRSFGRGILKQDALGQTGEPLLWIGSDNDILYADPTASTLYHFDWSGLVKAKYQIDLKLTTSAPPPQQQKKSLFRTLDIQFESGRYHLLLLRTPGDTVPSTMVFSFSEKGADPRLTATPFNCDGFDLSAGLILYYQSKKGNLTAYESD